MSKARVKISLLLIALVCLTVFSSACQSIIKAPEAEPLPEITAEPVNATEEERVLTKFSDMRYYRPDAIAAAKTIEELTAAVDDFANIDDLKIAFEAADALYCTYDTMYALSVINASMDRSNEFWVEEERVLLEGYATLDKASGELMIKLYESRFKEQIEKDWEEGFFDHIENAYFTNELTKPLYEREAALESEQKDRLALATVKFKDENLTYEGIQALEDYYDWAEATTLWYKAYNDEFASRYIELVKVRNQIASTLGFDSYAEYAFLREQKDYTPDMARKLIDDIAKELVPVYNELQKMGRYWPDANMSREDFVEFFGSILGSMDEGMSDVLDIMIEYELCDMIPRAYKDGGAFTIYIYDYDEPFILCSFTNDLYSMSTFAHEFGHFYYAYVSKIDPPANNDLSEVHSQTMEILLANHYGDQLDEELAYKMLYDSLYRMFTTIVGQPYYTSFELRAYELSEEELTVSNLNQIAHSEAERFGMGTFFPGYTMYDWVTVPHIFDRPFSTFGYVTSAAATIEIWEISQTDEQKALDVFEKTVYREGEGEFLGVLSAAGLKSPFDNGRMKEIAAWAKKYLIDEALMPGGAQ